MANRKKSVDLSRYRFLIEPRYYFYGWSKSPRIFSRESAAKALAKARQFLPKGYNFKIWDGKRSYEVQLAMLASIARRIKLAHQDFSKKELEEEVLKFGGSADRQTKRLDTHQSGGSFDLTLVDRWGLELYMGTDHDDLTERAATDYYEKKPQLNLLEKESKKNRRLLKKVIEKAGFINYPPEWWHWSYNK